MKIESKLLSSILDIPLIKDGKCGVDELHSFHADVAMWFRLKNYVYMYPEQAKQSFKLWEDFIRKRNDEDFIPHSVSEHYSLYRTLFLKIY
jgi:hypothetical protein